jgi:hypothetical protein
LETYREWNWNAWDRGWKENIALLRQFIAREGHARVPLRHIEAGSPLGKWVARQRARYKAGKLTAEKAGEIDAIIKASADVSEAARNGADGAPSEWDANWMETRGTIAWKLHYQALLRYYEEHGNTNVPRKFTQDGIAIGIWLNSVRTRYNKGTLAPDRVQMLEAIPGWKWVLGARKSTPVAASNSVRSSATRESTTAKENRHERV